MKLILSAMLVGGLIAASCPGTSVAAPSFDSRSLSAAVDSAKMTEPAHYRHYRYYARPHYYQRPYSYGPHYYGRRYYQPYYYAPRLHYPHRHYYYRSW